MNHAILTPDQVLQQLNWRYATKKFDASKPISDEVWKALEQSLVLSPSSFGQQPWKFFVIRNTELRQQLQEHAFNQSQVVDASHFVVLAAKQNIDNSDVDRYIERAVEVQGVSREQLSGLENAIKGFLQNPPFPFDAQAWATRQVYIALGFLMYSAAMLGLDACPMEGFIPSKFDEILGLPEKGYATAVLCTLGYRAEDDRLAGAPKVRYETGAVVEYID
ncbi:MAG: NAD(P)H-dependent oxidoreductase [Cyanobacteria bacterium P01_C01_bin.120]